MRNIVKNFLTKSLFLINVNGLIMTFVSKDGMCNSHSIRLDWIQLGFTKRYLLWVELRFQVFFYSIKRGLLTY